MKHCLSLFLWMIAAVSVNGQAADTTAPAVRGQSKIRVGVSTLQFVREAKLGQFTTLELAAGFSGGYDISEDAINYSINLFRPALTVSVSPRFYYNLDKRAARGKSTRNNAANYLGARFRYVTAEPVAGDATRRSVLVNLHWGMQRNMGKRWLFNFHTGAGYAQDVEYNFGTIYPSFDVQFAYRLGRNSN